MKLKYMQDGILFGSSFKKERKGEFVCLTNNWKGDYLRSSLA